MKRGKKKAEAQLERNIYIDVGGAAAHQTEDRKVERREQRKEESLRRTGYEISAFLHGWRRVQRPLKRVGLPVCHHAVHLVDGCGERPQTHLLRLLDDLGARLHPLLRHHHIFVSVHQEVKGTWTERTVGHITTL